MTWSRNAEKCVSCGTVHVPHRRRGMCGPCLYKWYEQKNKAHWNKYFEAYKDYVQTMGQQPSWTFTRHKGVAIGKWLYREILPKKGSLSPEQVTLLEELGLDWNLQQLPGTTRKRPRQSNPSGTKKKPRQGQGEI